MRVLPEALISALRSAAPNVTGSGSTGGNVGSIETDEVIMKLAKKNDQAVLSFDKAFSGSGRRGRLTQDVKVDVEKIETLKLNEPMRPEPDIRDIVSPPLVKLRTIVDRMKGMADFLTFRA
ncbi:hypothetical protein K435DRAFT_899285, partial [Dendrothele bispora CBS 962.96]